MMLSFILNKAESTVVPVILIALILQNLMLKDVEVKLLKDINKFLAEDIYLV